MRIEILKSVVRIENVSAVKKFTTRPFNREKMKMQHQRATQCPT